MLQYVTECRCALSAFISIRGTFLARIFVRTGVAMEAKSQTPLQEDRFSIVERVARIVSNVRGAKPDYARLAAELSPAIPFDIFGIVLLRHDRQAARVTVCAREGERWVARYHQLPLHDSMLERVLESSVPSTTHAGQADASQELITQTYPTGLDGPPVECGDALSSHPQLRATLIAPLYVDDHVLGTLELGSVDITAYADESRLRIIHAVIQVLAAAIESAQVGGSVEIQDRQRQELQKVSSALASKMDLPTILKRVVDGIAKSLNVASAIVMLDRASGKLRLDTQHGLNAVHLQSLVQRKQALSDSSIIGATLRRQQPLVSNDIAQDEHFPVSSAFASELGMRSVFSYPLAAGSTVFGALLLLSPEPGGFTPLKVDILSLFASQAMIAIQQGMLLGSIRERQRFQGAVDSLERAFQQASTQEDELALFKTMREIALRDLGISFSSLLHIMSEHLLTRSERDIQAIFYDEEMEESEGADVEAQFDGSVDQSLPHEQDVAVLIHTVESALARAGLLSDAGAALTAAFDPRLLLERSATSAIPQLYEQVTRDMQDPWFIVDLHGQCIYMNPAAEALCGMRLDLKRAGSMALGAPFFAEEDESPLHSRALPQLRETLDRLLPRVRNDSEVLAYLSEFERPDILKKHGGEALQLLGEDHERVPKLSPLPTDSLRCVIAAEPVARGHSLLSSELAGLDSRPFPGIGNSAGMFRFSGRSLTLDNAPSDRHYQFMRYALYDQHDELIAHALQIHDITEQVRDERNKSALLSSVSHDLRTPLTAIKAAVSGLLQPDVEWDEQTRHEMLVDIDAEADHLHSLINSMVEMSRIEMGALALEKEWCDLVEIVHNTIAHISRALAGHSIQTDFEPHLPLVQVDYLQLKRVFYNLLENAARHSSKEQTILISARAVPLDSGEERSERASRYIRIAVVDHGNGIPEGERERVFRSFYSPDGQTGLGLAICRGIIEAHQGRIWVESTPGGGASFVLVLPVSS
jgi:signal transduction histidine kinase/GAF domain-containing protein